jgi:hypothetical protein
MGSRNAAVNGNSVPVHTTHRQTPGTRGGAFSCLAKPSDGNVLTGVASSPCREFHQHLDLSGPDTTR